MFPKLTFRGQEDDTSALCESMQFYAFLWDPAFLNNFASAFSLFDPCDCQIDLSTVGIVIRNDNLALAVVMSGQIIPNVLGVQNQRGDSMSR